MHTDSSIKYLMNKKDAKPRLIRWVLDEDNEAPMKAKVQPNFRTPPG
jgi:hypothetical protein